MIAIKWLQGSFDDGFLVLLAMDASSADGNVTIGYRFVG